jgi:hypothetical protein
MSGLLVFGKSVSVNKPGVDAATPKKPVNKRTMNNIARMNRCMSCFIIHNTAALFDYTLTSWPAKNRVAPRPCHVAGFTQFSAAKLKSGQTHDDMAKVQI